VHLQCTSTARRYLTQDKTLDTHIFLRFINHSQALKHDVDFPNNLGACQAVGDGTQLDWLCVAVVFSEPQASIV